MPVWFIMLVLSVAFGVWSVVFGDNSINDLTLLAGIMAVTCLLLPVILPHADRGRRPRPQQNTRRDQIADKRSTPRRACAPQRGLRGRSTPDLARDADGAVLVDGSNVLYWQGGKPSLDSVARVVRVLESQGLTPLVGFDANVGYLVEKRYMNGRDLASRLDLPEEQVSVSPKGQPADPLLIAEAVRLGARIITNDRYRDWQDEFPQVTQPGFLVRGHIDGTAANLEIMQAAA